MTAILAAIRRILDEDGQLELTDVIDKLFDQDASAVIFKMTDINERGEKFVYHYKDGERIAIKMGDVRIAQDIFKTIEGLGTRNTETVIQYLSMGAIALRFGVVKAPSYVVRNFMRDNVAMPILSEGMVPFWHSSKGLKDVLTNSAAAKRYAFHMGMQGGVDSNLVDTLHDNRDAMALRTRGFFATPATTRRGTVIKKILRGAEITVTTGTLDRAATCVVCRASATMVPLS